MTQKLNKTISADNVSKVMIENYNAYLKIMPNTEKQVSIEVELNANIEDDDFQLEDYITVKKDEDKICIVIDEISSQFNRYKDFDRYEAIVLVPQGLEISAESDNYALKLIDLDNPLSVVNENGPIVITNCKSNSKIKNENGPIKINALTGNIEINEENGPVSAENIQGDELIIKSENGPVKIRSSRFNRVNITNENGMVYYETLHIEEGKFKLTNENGHIHLVTPADFDFELFAITEMGSIKNHTLAELSMSPDGAFIKQGEGKVKVHIKTENGLIKISSGEGLNFDAIRSRLATLKTKIAISKTLQDREEIQKQINSILDYLEKLILSVNEQSMKIRINQMIETLKTLKEKIINDETAESIINYINSLPTEIGKIFKNIEVEFGQFFDKEQFSGKIKDMVSNLKQMYQKGFEHLKDFAPGKMDLNEKENEAVKDRSRLKILELLESGKITAEEAEKLLKAIKKE